MKTVHDCNIKESRLKCNGYRIQIKAMYDVKTIDISGTEKKECLKPKIEGHETNSKIKNIGDFKKGYQPRINIVKDEKGDLVADCHSISARWRNHISQLFNVIGVSDVGQAKEIHTAEPLEPEPSAFETESAI
jgi:hypothetical protein